MKVLFKDEDPTRPSNYRPICTLPALYKLFACLLYQRLDMYLGLEQSCDQAGFRKGFSIIDHIFNCALDSKKAFDTVEHGSLWEALRGQGVPEPYIQLLRSLSADQRGRVRTDVLSD
eukprot:3445521-Pyramimonas_sp.AAC.1